MLAWTTTPWTLPSNLALCVNPELKCACLSVNQDRYIGVPASFGLCVSRYLQVQNKTTNTKWIVGKESFNPQQSTNHFPLLLMFKMNINRENLMSGQTMINEGLNDGVIGK